MISVAAVSSAVTVDGALGMYVLSGVQSMGMTGGGGST